MPEGYLRHRQAYESIGGQVYIDPTDVTVVPIAAKPFYTVYIERLVADVIDPSSTIGAQWIVTDTNGTPLTAPIAADASGQNVRDFGSKGIATQEGEGLQFTLDPGASGQVSWEGYRKLTGVGAT